MQECLTCDKQSSVASSLDCISLPLHLNGDLLKNDRAYLACVSTHEFASMPYKERVLGEMGSYLVGLLGLIRGLFCPLASYFCVFSVCFLGIYYWKRDAVDLCLSFIGIWRALIKLVSILAVTCLVLFQPCILNNLGKPLVTFFP